MKPALLPWPDVPLRESLSQSPEALCLDCGLREPLAEYRHRRCGPCVRVRFKSGQDFCDECHVATVPRGKFNCAPCLEKIRARMPEFSVCACGRAFIGERDECHQCWGEYAGEVL